MSLIFNFGLSYHIDFKSMVEFIKRQLRNKDMSYHINFKFQSWNYSW